jgi:hypothetical protein
MITGSTTRDTHVGPYWLIGANFSSRHDRWLVILDGKGIGYITRYSARQWAARGPSARHREQVRHTRREALALLTDAYAS